MHDGSFGEQFTVEPSAQKLRGLASDRDGLEACQSTREPLTWSEPAATAQPMTCREFAEWMKSELDRMADDWDRPQKAAPDGLPQTFQSFEWLECFAIRCGIA